MTDAELFALAIAKGWHNDTANRTLRSSTCYGVGYTDTKFWTAPYGQDEHGLPEFDPPTRILLEGILVHDRHMKTWNRLQEAEAAVQTARKTHQAFMAREGL